MIPTNTNTSTLSSLSFRQSILTTEFDSYNRKDVIDFLKISHVNYEKVIIPQIEQSFLGLMKLLPNEPSLGVIFNLFIKFQISLELHMKIEEQTLYPLALEQDAAVQSKIADGASHEEPFLTEIIGCLNRQSYARNPFCQTLINRLVNFNEELKNHAWIEEHLI
ncbi:MAG: hypothetical protein AB8B56_09395 [Crocinitomicaceae bacterium]